MLMMAVAIQACTSKKLQKQTSKVDSSATAITTYGRTIITEQKGTDSILNPTPGISVEFDGCDTGEHKFSTPLYDLIIKGGKNGSAKVNPKPDAKVATPVDRKTTVHESGTTYQNTDVKKETKQTDKKVNTSGLWGIWVSLALLIIACWLYKRIYR
jgi:hypothetical protein